MQPETVPKILVSDTVGFIKKLPHDLVASFRSTLDEAQAAALQLFIIDGSDENFRSQLEVAREVIRDIGAADRPHRLVINKIDLLSEIELTRLRKEYPDALFISSHSSDDIDRIRKSILDFFEQGMTDFEMHIPYSEGHLIAKVRVHARILSESHDEIGTQLIIRADENVKRWLEKLKQSSHY